MEKMLNKRTLLAYLGMSDSTLSRLLKTDSDFPRPVRIGRRFRVWRESEIDEFLKNLKPDSLRPSPAALARAAHAREEKEIQSMKRGN
jgi:predicted DNA-binding transcriptional regulator AlpA